MSTKSWCPSKVFHDRGDQARGHIAAQTFQGRGVFRKVRRRVGADVVSLPEGEVGGVIDCVVRFGIEDNDPDAHRDQDLRGPAVRGIENDGPGRNRGDDPLDNGVAAFRARLDGKSSAEPPE